MNKIIIAAIAIVVGSQVLFMGAGSAHALSCLPVDMYLDMVVNDENDQTFVFVGTATAVTKNHTQVVTVTKALKENVDPKMWVTHPYDDDWQYYCSGGPADAGESTIFLGTWDAYGSFMVHQTLDVDSAIAKKFMASIEKADFDASIRMDTTTEDKAETVKQRIEQLIKVIMGLLDEYRYWQSNPTRTATGALVPPASSQSVTFDAGVLDQKLDVQAGCKTFAQEPCGFVTFSGTATNVSSMHVVLVKDSFQGRGGDYDALLEASMAEDTPLAEIHTVSVSGGVWQTKFTTSKGAFNIVLFNTDTKKHLAARNVDVR